jgi:hypothetical protein
VRMSLVQRSPSRASARAMAFYELPVVEDAECVWGVQRPGLPCEPRSLAQPKLPSCESFAGSDLFDTCQARGVPCRREKGSGEIGLHDWSIVPWGFIEGAHSKTPFLGSFKRHDFVAG